MFLEKSILRKTDGGAQKKDLITGLLVSAVALVPLMAYNMLDANGFRRLNRFIGRVVIHQDHLIHNIHGYFAVRLLQCECRIIRRHHNHNLFVFQHNNRLRFIKPQKYTF